MTDSVSAIRKGYSKRLHLLWPALLEVRGSARRRERSLTRREAALLAGVAAGAGLAACRSSHAPSPPRCDPCRGSQRPRTDSLRGRRRLSSRRRFPGRRADPPFHLGP